MKANTITTTLVACAICAACVAALRWASVESGSATRPAGVPALWHNARPVSDSAFDDAENFIAINDPFRLSNTTPKVRYDPATDGTQVGLGAPAQPVIRPVLVLKAIVGGPPWQAVVDGIPGQPAGTIARQGAKFDALTVQSVTRDSVVVRGPDTTWVLSFRGRS